MHWQLGPGKSVAVVGSGGLWTYGYCLNWQMQHGGAKVTAISRSANKQLMHWLWGIEYLATADPGTIEKAQGSFDLIINTVSSAADMNTYLGLLKRDGVMVLVGAPEEALPVHPFSIIPKRKSLAGSTIGGMPETQEMLDFCGKHKIGADIEIIPVDKINEAYKRLAKSDVRYRFVIDISSLK